MTGWVAHWAVVTLMWASTTLAKMLHAGARCAATASNRDPAAQIAPLLFGQHVSVYNRLLGHWEAQLGSSGAGQVAAVCK